MRHLQVFTAMRAIARLGSIRRAAHALSISPSALNRQVLALEEELGAPIFERLSSGVRLSTAGEIFIKCFADHAADLERARAQIADLSGLRAGVVRIGVGAELAERFLPGHVASHLSDFPGVSFDVQTIAFDQLQEKLASYDVDLALAVNPQLGDDVDVITARESRVLAIAAPWPDAQFEPEKPLHFSSLADSPLIAPARGGGLRNLLDAAFAAKRVAPRYVAESDGGIDALLAATPGALRPRLEEETDRDALASRGGVARPFAEGVFPVATIRLCRLRARALPVATEQFARRISQSLD